MLSPQSLNTRVIGILAIAFFVLAISLWVSQSDAPEAMGALFSPTTTAKKRDFIVEVVEAATLDARQSVLLSSELPSNRAKVIYLAPEGEIVARGDVVARFDRTSFEEDIQKLESDIQEQKIKLRQAVAELSLQESESTNRLAEMAYQKELATLKLDALEKGGMLVRKAQTSKEAVRTSASFKTDSAALKTEQELFDEGLTNRKSLTAAQDKAAESKAAYELAQQNLRVLEQVTLPSELRQAQLQLANREREMDSFKLAMAQQEARKRGAVSQSEHRIKALTQELERSRGYLEKTEVLAPVSGIVLYKVISNQGEKRKTQVGDSLWNRNSFAVLPDLSNMVAIVEVRENEIGKLAVGQPARIQPEAYPELHLEGVVHSIGTLAAEQKDRLSRYFSVHITLKDADNRLRPGMSAKASVLVHEYRDILVVPVEAIFYEQQSPVVFLWRDGNPAATPVELGKSDGKHIAILQGLEAGEEIMLVYPQSFERSQ